ncbi:MAG: Rhs family protein, partial [uncultured bacterium]
MQVKNSYNELGYLVQISDAQTGKVYWKLNAKDAAGHIISESRSNGLITNYTYSPKTGFLDDIETVLNTSLSIQKDLMPALAGTTITKEPNKSSATTSLDTLSVSSPKIGSVVQKEIYRYDVFGNVTAHQDGINAVTENFQYDDLNRLVGIESSGRADQTLFYDALGNIISKSDVGAYKYGENGAGPHALTSIKGKQPGTFEYNANGDQIKGTLNGIERTITYTSYSKPLTITTSKATVSFYYNAEREKFARVDNGPSKIATT